MTKSAIHSMYFLAIVCPGPINDEVLQFKNRMRDQFGCRVALKSPAHITLIAPFWLNQEREEELLEAIQSFTSDMDEIEINLDGFFHFGNRVLFVNVRMNPALEELKNQVQDYFVRSFSDIIGKDERPFHPHITIANRDLKPGDFLKAWEYFSKKEFKEMFRAKTIALLKLTEGKWNMVSECNWQ